MKMQVTSIALALLAGTITASGQAQQRRQKPQRRPQAIQEWQEQQVCPVCGAPKQRQHRGQHQRAYKQQQPQRQGINRQFAQQQRRKALQFEKRNQQTPPRLSPQQHKRPQPKNQNQQLKGRNQQAPPQLSPQQRQQIQKMHKLILQRYDRDGDGRLSEREHQAVKRALIQGGKDQQRPAKKPAKQKQHDQPKKRK